jgi:hypothetical protein
MIQVNYMIGLQVKYSYHAESRLWKKYCTANLKRTRKHFLMIYYEDFFRLTSFRVTYLQYLLYEEGNTVSLIYLFICR